MFEFLPPSKGVLGVDSPNYSAGDPYEIYFSGFWRCEEREITELERLIGVQMPIQLRHYYLERGVGTFRNNDTPESFSYNNVLIPSDIPKLMAGTCEWMMPNVNIEPDTLPFFERDVNLFLCVKPKSLEPDAVWWMWGQNLPNSGKVSNSLVEFFERLRLDPDWFSLPNG